MKKSICCLLIVIFCSFCISGCFDYKDINTTLFATSVVIDIDSNNKPIIYVEAFTTSSSDSNEEVGKENKTIYKLTGDSLYDELIQLANMTNYDLDYSQNKSIIFTEKAAEFGIDKFIDAFNRGRDDLLLREYVFVSDSDPMTLLKVKPDEEAYLGIFLSELARKDSRYSEGTTLRLDELLNNRLMGSKVNLINTIKICSGTSKPKVELNGLAVIQEDKMVGRLTLKEAIAYNFMSNTFKQGSITFNNPQNENKVVSLKILDSKTSTKLTYEDNVLHINKAISPKASFSYSEDKLDIISSDIRSLVEKNGEEYIKSQCIKLFNDYKDKNIDIFNIQRDFEMKYPKQKIKDPLKNTVLNLSVNINIIGSGSVKNFQ